MLVSIIARTSKYVKQLLQLYRNYKHIKLLVNRWYKIL